MGDRLAHGAYFERSAMIVIFLSSVPLIPKKVAIWRIWPVPTKSPGLLQNFSIPGSNSRQLIRLGILSPRPQSPDCCCCTQNSQINISHSLTTERFLVSRVSPLLRERLRARVDAGNVRVPVNLMPAISVSQSS